MSWRTVLISSRCKLDYSMGYMVIRGEDPTLTTLTHVARFVHALMDLSKRIGLE